MDGRRFGGKVSFVANNFFNESLIPMQRVKKIVLIVSEYLAKHDVYNNLTTASFPLDKILKEDLEDCISCT